MLGLHFIDPRRACDPRAILALDADRDRLRANRSLDANVDLYGSLRNAIQEHLRFSDCGPIRKIDPDEVDEPLEIICSLRH